MGIDLKQFHQVFFEESQEHLANMESSLLDLEGGAGDPEVVNVIFRGAHSIKGGSGTFGFTVVAGFTHIMETLLDRVRSGEYAITREVVTALLESVDVLREMIDALKAGESGACARATPVQQKLEALLNGGNAAAPSSAPAADAAGGNGGWRIRFRPHRHLLRTGNDPGLMFRELAKLGELETAVDTEAVPPYTDMDPEDCYLAWNIVLRGDTPRASVEEIFAWVEDDCDLDIEPLGTAQTAPAVKPAAPPPAAANTAPPPASATPVVPAAPATPERREGKDRRQPGESESIRVSTDKIDAIINMVGELVITQSMLSQIGMAMNEFNAQALEKLRDGLSQLERNTRELQEGVMRIRMLPISFAFSRFPRLVHDLSQKLGKKVELKLSGEQTELDKTVMEKIGDPLVHLVRNSLDHGVETPDVRREAGKPETGQIHLNAYHQGGNIVIEVSDDGAGLNKERILAKARERGVIAQDATLTDEQITDLIFEAGFSTATVVSDVSGRGVGMDVVRRNIRDLGGSVEVRSKQGQGSCFTIRLPLTLAILDGQLIRVADQIYITPLVSIIESLQIRPDRLNQVAGRTEVYRLRDDYIPIIHLRSAFSLTPREGSLADALLVVVEGEGQKVGMVVDDLLGQQQVVIKSLETNFKPVPGISGATILGDGTVALILDTSGLVKMACRDGLGELTTAPVAAAA